MSSDLSALSKGELITIIFNQAGEIEILKEKIIELQEKLGQKGEGGSPSKSTPSWVKANVKKKKGSTRKQREHGFGRSLDIPTQKVFHSYDACPDCGSKNLGNTVSKDEIFTEVWKDSEDATDWALDALIYRLRKHPFMQSNGYIIENQKKVGYTLIQT